MHLGDNDWCIVDSCIPRSRAEPAAIEYLNSFGTGALEKVKVIVATHWHDDHIRGLASILQCASEASFYCSMALGTGEFLKLVAIAEVSLPGNSGVEEFASILEILMQRRESTSKKLVTPKYALENRKLLDLSGNARSFSARVTALSPSDGTVKLALDEIAQLLPRPGEPQRRIVNRSPNHASVVLWIEAGDKRVLLGADLEHTNRQGEGWLAVLASHQDNLPAQLFKVPHHGSANADCASVWSTMLTNNPIAIITPFSAAVRLPRESDLRRVSARTNNLYCTAASLGRAPRREPIVEKRMKEVVTQRQVITGQAGHVRVRWSMPDKSAQPQIEVFNGAYQVQ